jgi:superfamily I DNA/RNA helicase
MAWDRELTGVHREIAADPRSPLHVLAGPGTGKTFALMRRVARLLEDGVAPDRILAVTFTRTAARDLREQLLALEVVGADQVKSSTLHSLCFSALLADAVFPATGRTARPLLSFEIEQLINDLKAEFGGKREVERLIEAYEAAWARLQHEEAGHAPSVGDQQFEAALINWLRYHRSMLIGELVPLTLKFLRDNPNVPVLPAFEHVLVDEYQDLNKPDQTLVKVLAQQGTLTVIGDDNQSIYSFRHANPEGVLVFPAETPGTVCYFIEECRRCPPNIVEISNALIMNNGRREPRVLRALPGRAPAEIHLVQHRTLDDEADAIAAFVERYLVINRELPPGQVLVLSPRRFIGQGIRDALIRRRLNAMSFFFEDELRTDSAAEGFCLLTLLADRADRAAFRAWIGLGRPTDGFARAYARVRAAAHDMNLEPSEVCARILARELRIPHTGRLVDRYQDLERRLARLEPLGGLELVDALWPAGNQDCVDLRITAGNLASENPDPMTLLPALKQEITQPELPPASGDVIRVMSLHKSKGLTASLVVVVGCVAGAIPTVDSSLSAPQQDAMYEEQRRLFYVAITRATATLVVSSVVALPLGLALRARIEVQSVFTQRNVRIGRTGASPFIGELGASAPNTVSGSVWRARLGF